jgi:hypothetical protein
LQSKHVFGILLAALVALTGLEIIALQHGINGLMLKSSFVGVGGIAGLAIRWRPGRDKK